MKTLPVIEREIIEVRLDLSNVVYQRQKEEKYGRVSLETLRACEDALRRLEVLTLQRARAKGEP